MHGFPDLDDEAGLDLEFVRIGQPQVGIWRVDTHRIPPLPGWPRGPN